MPMNRATGKKANSTCEAIPFIYASFSASNGLYSLQGVSDEFRAFVGWPVHAKLPQDLNGVISEFDKAKMNSALQFAAIYSPEGETAISLIRLKKKNGDYVPCNVLCRGTKKKTHYFIAVVFTPKVEANPPFKPANSSEEIALSGQVLAKIDGDLQDNRILSETVPPSPFSAYFPMDNDYGEWLKKMMAFPLAKPERISELKDFLDPHALLAAFEKGERLFHLRVRLAPVKDVPIWVDFTLTTFLSSPKEHICFSLEADDVSESVLEKEMMSQLVLLGFDVLGLVYLPNQKCRFFRMEKMGLGMESTSTVDYYEATLGDIETIVEKDEVEEIRKALSLDTITANLEKWPTYVVSYTINRRDGQKKRKRFQFSYLDEDKKTLFFVRSDLTATYLKEQEQIAKLREAKLKAEEANESKSIFLSSMSHDIRSPLNGILGFTELALREKDPEKKDEDLSLIRSSGTFLLGLVNDTLDLSRFESGKATLDLAPVDLRESFATVLSSLEGAAQIKSITIIEDNEAPNDTVLTDGLKFQKVFLNLLSNAIKYTPSGGLVHVSLFAHPIDENQCNYTLIVSDNGIGIKKEFLPHIFDAFSQEKRPEAKNILGTGLGLSIVKRIVTMMNGHIVVDSVVNQGTKFSVSFPFSPVEKTPKEKTSLPDDALFKGKRVLLFEDNEINAQIEKILFEEKGLLVDWAENGKVGVETFEASAQGYYSAIFLDNQMPVMGGVEAAKKIRSLERDDAKRIPLIALTGDAFPEDLRSFTEAGMDGYVVKPVDSYRLFSLLEKLWQKEN